MHVSSAAAPRKCPRTFPRTIGVVSDQPQIGFVNQCGGLQSLARLFILPTVGLPNPATPCRLSGRSCSEAAGSPFSIWLRMLVTSVITTHDITSYTRIAIKKHRHNTDCSKDTKQMEFVEWQTFEVPWYIASDFGSCSDLMGNQKTLEIWLAEITAISAFLAR